MAWIHVVLFIVAILLIILVMVQESKDDVRNTFSGEKSDLFKNQKQRGSELFMTRITIGLSVAFVVIAILTFLPAFSF